MTLSPRWRNTALSYSGGEAKRLSTEPYKIKREGSSRRKEFVFDEALSRENQKVLQRRDAWSSEEQRLQQLPQAEEKGTHSHIDPGNFSY